MSDEIRPPMPTNPQSGSSRESINREQGRGAELTSTVVTQEGKLGILLNKQFVPFTIALDAKIGDVVRVRIDQVGKESSIRVLRILEAVAVTAPSVPVNSRSLRDLFPPEAIRSLQELFISLQEVLDVTMVDEARQLGSTLQQPKPLISPEASPSSAHDPLPFDITREVLQGHGDTPPPLVSPAPRFAPPPDSQIQRTNVSQELPPFANLIEEELLAPADDRVADPDIAALPRHFPIPAAYGAPTNNRQTIPRTEGPPPSAVPLPLAVKPPTQTVTQSILSSLSAAFLEPTLVIGSTVSPHEALMTFVKKVMSARVAPPSPERVAPAPINGGIGAAPHERALIRTGTRIPAERTQPGPPTPNLPTPDEVRSTDHRASALRFNQSVTDAQPILDQCNRLFESLNQPSYLLSAILIGSHIIPLELSTFRDSPPVERSEEEGGIRSPLHRGFSRVRMTIHLPTLGSVGIDIAYRESEVLLKFSSTSPTVTQFLSGELPLFSKELENEGFHLISWFTDNAQPASIAPLWFQDLVAGDIVA